VKRRKPELKYVREAVGKKKRDSTAPQGEKTRPEVLGNFQKGEDGVKKGTV